jgi:hypothetical protein
MLAAGACLHSSLLCAAGTMAVSLGVGTEVLVTRSKGIQTGAAWVQGVVRKVDGAQVLVQYAKPLPTDPVRC